MRRNKPFLTGVFIAALLLPPSPAGAAESGPAKRVPPAELSVSGLGWWSNREMRLSLDRLLGEERGPTVEANAIEDAAFLLISALAQEGFLNPTVEAQLTLADGGRISYSFDATLATLLPRTVAARAVHFKVFEGVRSVVDEVNITGLSAIPARTARSYFRANDTPLVSAAARAYSPPGLHRSADNLLEDLRQRGYAEATVQARVVAENAETGEVTVLVEVSEGPRWSVTRIEVGGAEGTGVVLDLNARWSGKPWSALWQQDVADDIRQTFYRSGYPDVRVRIDSTPGSPADGRRPVTASARVTPGPAVRLKAVRFEGNEHTRERTLRRRVRAKEGEPLNPLVLDRTRYRLARLGIFSTVDLHYEPTDGTEREAVFTLREMPRWDAHLLMGYGSYEMLRGGVELEQKNLFGRAHQSRLELVQSMKSTRGDYVYSVPDLFGESLDGSARLFGLRREEQAFVREELGGTVAVKRRLRSLGADASLGYTYQSLTNQDNELSTSTVDDGRVQVASIDLGLTRDRRDSPLQPRKGYRSFAQASLANEVLGSQVNYQLFELGAAWHTAVGTGRWIHAGLTHGFITQAGARGDQRLPVNKLFYPGGESSIRGYQQGEAAPRGPDGRFVGAETYLLANFELEQALTQSWSLVAFADGLGMAATMGDYPFDETLLSVGLGVRYQTLIGPIRLEYGRNLNPRANDPGGTLHFSVGFPF